MENITSPNNELIKKIKSLKDKKYRKFYGEYLVEGEHMVREAILTGQNIVCVVCQTTSYEKFEHTLQPIQNLVKLVPPNLFSQLSETVTPQGILAILSMRPSKEFIPYKPFLVLDRLQDPGNLGTIIRTAAATGFRDIVLLQTVDPFNPKTVRSSSSGIFFTSFYPMQQEELLALLQKEHIPLYTADAGGENIFTFQINEPVYGLAIGNEAAGPSDALIEASTSLVALPMLREMESLNAGISASVLMYLCNGKNIHNE